MDANTSPNGGNGKGWKVTFQISRQKGTEGPHFQSFTIETNPDEYVLDVVERIWAFHDRSLTFRHACHHSTCGACGMRVNGVEKLTCITPISSVTTDGGVVQVEPLRNFPVISDLVVDMGTFYQRMEASRQRTILPVDQEGVPTHPPTPDPEHDDLRLADCIECGLCISACPIATTTTAYIGPAVLAGAQQAGLKNNSGLISLVDQEDGLWRCHSAFECSAVCPSFVDPAWRIMDLRRQVMSERFRNLFRPSVPDKKEARYA